MELGAQTSITRASAPAGHRWSHSQRRALGRPFFQCGRLYTGEAEAPPSPATAGGRLRPETGAWPRSRQRLSGLLWARRGWSSRSFTSNSSTSSSERLGDRIGWERLREATSRRKRRLSGLPPSLMQRASPLQMEGGTDGLPRPDTPPGRRGGQLFFWGSNSRRLLVDEEAQDLQLTNCRVTENLCAAARWFNEPARNGIVLRPQRRGCAGRAGYDCSISGVYVGIRGILMFPPVGVSFARAAASRILPALKKLGQRVKADESLRDG